MASLGHNVDCIFLKQPHVFYKIFWVFTRGQFWPSGIVIACVCGSVCVCINHELVRTITHHPFKLGSPNLDQRCKTPWFGSLLFLGMIDLESRPWGSTWKSNFTSFWACSHHYSSAIQARITKFGPKMHLSTVKIPTNFGLDWLWSSLSFSILKPIFYQIYLHPFCIYLVRPVACKY